MVKEKLARYIHIYSSNAHSDIHNISIIAVLKAGIKCIRILSL